MGNNLKVGTLVLIDATSICIPKRGDFISNDGKVMHLCTYDWNVTDLQKQNNITPVKVFKPVIICEDNITLDDWSILLDDYGTPMSLPQQYKGVNAGHHLNKGLKKVLVMPDQFSKVFLNMIVDGEVKNGDCVQVEIEDVGREEWMGDDYTGEPVWFEKIQVSLDLNGKATIYQNTLAQ